ncbi:MAG: hypothetical protein R2776_10040 [Flavobacteriaceae bacterium]|nr:hypothetical protein [Flavobacteriaceae bacterium]
MKLSLLFLLFLVVLSGQAQDTLSNYRTKKVKVQETVLVDSLSINPFKFSILDTDGKVISSSTYSVDFVNGAITFSEEIQQELDSVTVNYLRYPIFLTREYYLLDSKIIAENTGSIEKLYALEKSNAQRTTSPFEGLNTQGSISRGITVGNNQNTVVSSELDLQITGKLSDRVSIRASLQDANIPNQEGGYSQNLDEFDQIFIELFSDHWNIRAGDIDLQNSQSYFGRFSKKIQGISLYGELLEEDGSKTSAFASGGLVRGVFQRSQFTGQEGNQGPYKLVGPNGELFILIVSGSERVYVNGLLLNRGENADYVIDYNAGELKFNPTYPITANMRISVEYQFTERSYTRFIGYGGGNYESESLKIGAYVFSESDAKNQPLQQNLTEEQVAVLAAAGDNTLLMTAPSAVSDTFSENKILYKKEVIDGVEAFVFSNNPEDELYNVRFSFVGTNQGNYRITSTESIANIFEYVAPVDGIAQGSYEPIIRLTPPQKLQIGGVNASYIPSEKTEIDFELAGSIYDQNLFSEINNDDNNGFASRLAVTQSLLKTADTLQIIGFGSFDYLHKDFKTIERFYNIEFNRDWNLETPLGNQSFFTAGAQITHPKAGNLRYEFQKLDFSENFSGNRHVTFTNLRFNKLHFINNTSYLTSKSDVLKTTFLRNYNNVAYTFKKAWVGGKFLHEDNQAKVISQDSLTPLSQRFSQYEVYTGVGDSTQVFAEVGYRYRVNDSLRTNRLQKVNTSNDYFLKSKLINNQNTQLSLFANYRFINFEADEQIDEKNLNTRVLYNQSLWKGKVRLNTAFETNNGVLPQQEFTFVKVEPGQGVFTWIDYNNNGVQELNEFEVAQFQDQAEYVKVLLPNQVFIRVKNNRFSQIVTLQPQEWINELGLKKVLSKFYNQTSYIIDRKIRKDNSLVTLNPFESGGEDELGLNLNFKNVLFFNRGKQRYTTSYTYLSSSSRNLISLGLQKNTLKSHQFNFTHQFETVWVANFKGVLGSNETFSENFENRNFNLENYTLNPKLSYLLNQQTRFDVFYQFMNEENTLGEMEQLTQQKVGVSFAYNNVEKISISGEFNYIDNAFTGSAFSPVAYTMLEGLQPGTNFTWNLLFQKRITKYLDANLSYFGRKSEAAKTIHTGSIQLRAFF